MLIKNWKINWAAIAIETFSVFIGILLAFLATEWGENRKDRATEKYILTEMHKTLGDDLRDMEDNKSGHELGLNAIKFMRTYIKSQPVSKDSMNYYSFVLTQSFLTILNTSVYENLKSQGFDLIINDSLRNKIIKHYGFEYKILEKMEEHYASTKFHENYHDQFMVIVGRSIELNDSLKLKTFKSYKPINPQERTQLFISLNEMQIMRRMLVMQYGKIIEATKSLQQTIEMELSKK